MAIRTLSKLLHSLKPQQNSVQTSIPLHKILHHFSERSFGFFIFLFALPCALPVPAVGYGTVLGIPLILLTGQLVMGRSSAWLPRRIYEKEIAVETLNAVIEKSLPYVQKLEYLTRPRLQFLTSKALQPILGILGLVMALFVSLPLPLTNTVPSLGLAVIGAGLVMRDGLAVLAGLMIGLGWCTLLTYFMITLGAEGAEAMKEMIKSVL